MRRSLKLTQRGERTVVLDVEQIHKMGEVHKGGNAAIRTTIWLKGKNQFIRVRHSLAEIEAMCPGISRVVRVVPPLVYERVEERRLAKIERKKEKRRLKREARLEKAVMAARKKKMVIPKGCGAPKRICIRCLTTRITRRQHAAWDRKICDGCFSNQT